MDEPARSNWERGAPKGPRPLIALLAFILVAGGGCAGLFVWLFNSPGLRVASEVYDAAPDIVTRAHYSSVNGRDTLTIQVARDVSREEAIELHCQLVYPLLIRENLGAKVVIVHPDNDFVLEGADCPSTPAASPPATGRQPIRSGDDRRPTTTLAVRSASPTHSGKPTPAS